MSKQNFDKLFKPASVAVVGASNQEGSIGQALMMNLKQSFGGKLYPVNLKSKKVAGLKAYTSISEIKQKVDLLVVAVPATIVPNILKEAGSLGIKAAVVISAGFKESGNFKLEQEIFDICQKYNISMIGPNCLGLLNPHIGLNASFAAKNAKQGNIAFISQSGAICTAILDSAEKYDLGFSKFVSVGNKTVIDEVQLFEYLAKDKETKFVAVYAEQLTNAKNIISAVDKLKKAGKPVIVLKAGKSEAASKAATSHTGALAGKDVVYEALFRQAGIIRASSVEEFFNYLKIFSNNDIASAKKLAIITNAGGPGVLATDAASAEAMFLASLSQKSKAMLAKSLPAAASLNNPIDLLGDARADRYKVALQVAMSDNNVESVVLILTPQSNTEVEAVAQEVIAFKKKSKKPIAAVFMGEAMVAKAINILRNNSVATFSFPEDAVKALGALASFYENKKQKKLKKLDSFKNINKDKVAKIIAQAKKLGIKAFPEAEAIEILKAYGFPVLKGELAVNQAQAIKIAKRINKDLVLKIVSRDILHKSDVGGIMLGIKPTEAGQKFTQMMREVKKNKPQAKIDGILIVEMIKDEGVEMILGSFSDPALGPAIMVGLGGIYVEALQDVSFGVLPLYFDDAKSMLENLKSVKILNGTRGEKAKDKNALIENILRLSALLNDFPEIKELDINPLLLMDKGLKVLDARIIID